MNNPCVFSADRAYRYLLTHEWEPLLSPGRYVLWIGLNPSTADENELDPTLRRIRAFTEQLGCSRFVMTNLFAFKATDPKEMMEASDPVGPSNDSSILDAAVGAERIVACCGNDGAHLKRERAVRELLGHLDLWCLGTNSDGSPKHPLYLAADTPMRLFQPKRPRYNSETSRNHAAVQNGY